MVSYKEAGKMLDKLVEALPQGIFDGLNGGVNLLEEAKSDSRGSYILGLYHNNMMGRYIEIFYGSFAELYGDIPAAQFERRLKSTLYHELTHHIEGLAGDRSLERWDELQDIIWEELDSEGILVGSILFVDDDDTALAPAAKALFNMYGAERCPDVPAESAGLFEAGTALQSDCRRAAEALGADFSGHEFKTVNGELFEKYDAVMCMTLAQVDELLERFPGSEEKVMCMDETDILRPKMRVNWKKAVERVNAVVNDETHQLRLYDGGPSPDRIAPEDIQIVRLGADTSETVIETIGKLEESHFSIPWTRTMLERSLSLENHFFFAAMCGETVLGYIGCQLILDEMEVFNVVVEGGYRRQHIGDRLVSHLAMLASTLKKTMPIERVTLEVRAGNAAAIALYEKHGFVQVGRRKNYYERPREDAVLMDLKIED